MGQGDVVAITNANFPSERVAQHTVNGRLLRIDARAMEVAKAVLSV